MLAVFSYLTIKYERFSSDVKTFQEFNTIIRNLKDDDPKEDTAENEGGNKLVKDSEKLKVYYRYFSRLSSCL